MSEALASRGQSTLGVRLTSCGALTQLAGLGVDAWLHSRDSTLASRESVFSLGNEGHVLLLAGLVLVGTGVAALLLNPLDAPRGSSRSRRVAPGAVVIAAALLLSGSAAAAGSRMSEAHQPHGGGTDHPAAAAGRSSTHSGAGGHGIAGGIPPMDASTTALLDGQLAAARVVAGRYPTVADAVADGFRPAAPYESLIGSHYLRFGDVDNVFDVTRPEMLLFDGDSPGSGLVGLSYYVVGSVAPEGFAGKADRWHQHAQTCLTPDGPAFAGDGYRQCRASGRNSWMLHAWVVAGWESPQGVFSDENARLS